MYGGRKMIFDDFDSLWFYSNILFPHPQPPSPLLIPPPPSCHQPYLLYSPKQKLDTPKSPFLETMVEQCGVKKDWVLSRVFSSPHPPPPLLLSPTPSQPSCQHHTPKQKLDTPKFPFLQTKQGQVMVEPYGEVGLMKTTESMKRDKKSPKSTSKRRNKEIWQFNELVEFREFGFISFEDNDELSPMSSKFYYPYFSCKMPPFNEGMAIKRYLKSWACAVASTVR